MVDFPNKTNPLISRVKISKPDFGNEMAMERERDFPNVKGHHWADLFLGDTMTLACANPWTSGPSRRRNHRFTFVAQLGLKMMKFSPLEIVLGEWAPSSLTTSFGMCVFCPWRMEARSGWIWTPSRQSEETIITYNNQRSRTFMKEVTKKVPSGYLT